jgi:polysaccharide pyruvyl transferase WcaK-like protein
MDKKWYPADVVGRGMILSREQIRHIRRSDVVVWGGGALLADNASRAKIPYWFLIILFLKWFMRKPIMAWAQGLVIESGIGSVLGRMALNKTDLITVRDQHSFSTLKRIRATGPPHYLTADPAVLLRAAAPETGRKILQAEEIPTDGTPLFAMALTFNPFHYNPKDWIPYMVAKSLGLRKEKKGGKMPALKKILARLGDELIAKYDCNVVLIPTYPAPWENDIQHLEDMIHLSKHRHRMFCIRQDVYPPHEYLAMWHHLHLVVAIPMHHSIFSAIMDVPCVALYYEPKGRDFLSSIDGTDRSLDVNTLFESGGLDKTLDVIDDTLANWREYSNRSHPLFEQMKARARKNADYLSGLLEMHGLFKG